MESNFIGYNYLKSFERIDEILSESDNSFEELNAIPPRAKLTFINGFYVNCSCLVVDIRKSTELTASHYRPKLAKLYRAYISETVAVMNGNPNCAEVNIIGDGISGIFKIPLTKDIDRVFSSAYTIASLIRVLNYKLKKNEIKEINIGMGLSYGRALMIKAGYEGSGINDVVWMGDVVNEAHELAGYGKREYSDGEIMVSDVFYQNLNEDNKEFLTLNNIRNCYNGDVGNAAMEEWRKMNCSS